MVCSLCNCSGHNKATCPLRAPAAEMRAYTELCAMLPALKTKEVSKPLVDPHMTWMREFARMLPVTKEVNNGLEGLSGCTNIFKEPKVVKSKKVTKSLEGLSGCTNIFKEPKVVKSKKVTKSLEGLSGCMNIFKEPKVVVNKKVTKSLEGLSGCMNIFKEPKVVKIKKHLKTCSACGEKGHNSRTCSNICMPCPPPKSYCFAGLTAKQAVAMARMMDCTPAY